MYEYLIATDGACRGNPGRGSWAVCVFNQNGSTHLGSLGEVSNLTTNNEMELTAILRALQWANKHEKRIHIKTDSNYAYKGITEWLDGWKSRGWKNSTGKPVKNLALWQALDNEIKNHTFEWVKGHANDRHNNMADTVCNRLLDK